MKKYEEVRKPNFRYCCHLGYLRPFCYFRLFLFYAVLFLGFLHLASCASSLVSKVFDSRVSSFLNGDAADQEALDYQALIGQFTDSRSQYNGFQNTFQVSATILNSQVTEAHLDKMGAYMQWDEKKQREEQEKKWQEMSAKANFMIFLYTPVKEHNNMYKENKSIWKVYLHQDGFRYTGQVKKVSRSFVELKSLFPYLTRFHKPYQVTFDVSMLDIESRPNQLTMTSSLGVAHLKYPGTTGVTSRSQRTEPQ